MFGLLQHTLNPDFLISRHIWGLSSMVAGPFNHPRVGDREHATFKNKVESNITICLFIVFHPAL